MNNLFKYATKELSQDAFLCWSINWLAEPSSHPMYMYGKSMLDLLLGDKKSETYTNVEVRTQYEKIDVLVLYLDNEGAPHALIIEDKTNTSEHGDQMLRYKKTLLEKAKGDITLQAYQNPKVHLAYIKTGIMYDEDVRMEGKGVTVIDLDGLLNVVSRYAPCCHSEILSDFNIHIQSIKDYRVQIETQIENGQYETALQDYYGQYYFLNKIFSERSKGRKIGNQFVDKEPNPSIYVDYIYAGTNNDGTPWSKYCFWGDKYPRNYADANTNEYHYLFWRIDCKWQQDGINDSFGYKPYIALRHYDEHAHSGVFSLDERKRIVYRKFLGYAKTECEKRSDYFTKVGAKENYKESDLLFIPLEKIEHLGLNEIQNLLMQITKSFDEHYATLYDGMEDALTAK